MTLKRLYLFCLLVALLGAAPSTYAQKGKSEVTVGYGFWSAYNLINGRPYRNSPGIGMLTYRHYVSNKVTIGMGFSYENIDNHGSYLSIVPEFTYCYMDNKDDRVRVRLYSGAAVGLSVFDDQYRYAAYYTHHIDESGVKFAGQANLLGVRVGRRLAFTTELGFGYRGLVNLGLSYRFKTHCCSHSVDQN